MNRRGFLQLLSAAPVAALAVVKSKAKAIPKPPKPQPKSETFMYLDVSFSMLPEDIKKAMEEAQEQNHRIFLWDLEVREYRDELISRGGTNIRAVHDHILKHNPDVAIIVTDGWFEHADWTKAGYLGKTKLEFRILFPPHMLIWGHRGKWNPTPALVPQHETPLFIDFE
jgi:hypothetical protein